MYDGAHTLPRTILTCSSMCLIDNEYIALDLLLTDLSDEAEASWDPNLTRQHYPTTLPNDVVR